MKLLVGAPVAERAWALPKWFGCLRSQTARPDGFLFAYSRSADDTAKLLRRHSFGSLHVDHVEEPFIPRRARNDDRERAFTELARHRNRLLKLALDFGADYYLSLDTDVFLTDPTTIEKLIQAIHGICALSSPLVYLSRHAAEMPAYNAGWWRTDDVGSATRAWGRPTLNDVEGSVMRRYLITDIPMAAVMMSREVIETCRYAYHETGEDAGFAQDLSIHGFRTCWRLDMNPPHVMEPEMLGDMVG